MVSSHWPNLKDVAVNSTIDASRIEIDRRWRRSKRNGSSAILAELEKLWKVDCQFSNTFTSVNNLNLNLRDSSVHFYHDPSDPGSLMLVGIIPKERTLILNHNVNTEKYMEFLWQLSLQFVCLCELSSQTDNSVFIDGINPNERVEFQVSEV